MSRSKSAARGAGQGSSSAPARLHFLAYHLLDLPEHPAIPGASSRVNAGAHAAHITGTLEGMWLMLVASAGWFLQLGNRAWAIAHGQWLARTTAESFLRGSADFLWGVMAAGPPSPRRRSLGPDQAHLDRVRGLTSQAKTCSAESYCERSSRGAALALVTATGGRTPKRLCPTSVGPSAPAAASSAGPTGTTAPPTQAFPAPRSGQP